MPIPSPTGNAYYSFFPYLQQGLSGLISHVDIDPAASPTNYNERASVNLNFTINQTPVGGGSDQALPLNRTVQLKGPGDITGISTSAVLKVSPKDSITNMEPNYLPYIEFYDEDFPWKYTPATAYNAGTSGQTDKLQLRPWISLVVLKEDEFESLPYNGVVSTIQIHNASVLPKHDSMWAWAHVHVNGDVYGGASQPSLSTGLNVLGNTLNSDPDLALSRIICPRKLDPNTPYHAFLIPTFETGRLAGTLNTDQIAGTYALKAAWDSSAVNLEMPTYYSWSFKTGTAGDFESLARLLQPRELNAEMGKRAVDLQRSGNARLESIQTKPTIDLEGVLKPLNIVSDDWNLSKSYPQALAEILNGPTILLTSGSSTDPVIAPPIYGRWHAAVDSVISPANGYSESSIHWIDKANLDPRFRLFAGIGAEVIRKNQDKYMQIAWEQVGEVMEANRKMRQLQLSLQANVQLHDKHIKKLGSLSEELVLNISGPIHTKIKVASNTDTVFQNVEDSILPLGMFSGAFRRLTRPKGPLLSSIDTSGTLTTQNFISDINSNNIQVVSAYQAPTQGTVWGGLGSVTTTGFTAGLNPVSNFFLTSPGVAYASSAILGPNSAATQTFINSVVGTGVTLATQPSYVFANLPSLPIPTTAESIETKIDPQITTLAWANNTITIQGQSQAFTSLNSLVMAAPKIITPMYTELAAQSSDWMMPGLNSVEQNSISLLLSDQKYLEAYMLGLNHEMARELLWRGYPTDQRGTCFCYFWGYDNANISDISQLPANCKDIKDIHYWTTGASGTGALANLGKNSGRSSTDNLLVLTIRGELLHKYPGAIIYLQKSKWDTNNGIPVDTKHRIEDTNYAPLYPVFSAHIDPDIYFLGFQAPGLTGASVKGSAFNNGNGDPGYYFVFQERAGELHFGADLDVPTTFGSWDDLNWGRLTNSSSPNYIDVTASMTAPTSNPDSVTWNNNAATVAYSLLQSPVRLLVHGSGLIQ